MRKLLTLHLLAPCLALAASSSVSLTGLSGNYTIPNSSAFNQVTSYWVDLRIHGYTIPTGSCSNLVQVGGPTLIRLCDPAASGGGILTTFDNVQTAGGVPNLANPPALTVVSGSRTNPMVLSLTSAPWPSVISPGSPITVWGDSDPSCPGLNGNHHVVSVTGFFVSIDYDGTGCSYTAGAKLYGQDVLLRLQINLTTNQITGETWNVDGSGYAIVAQAITAANRNTFPESAQIGPAPTNLAYARWCAGTIPLNSTPPTGSLTSPCGNGSVLGDWEFEGNMADSGPNRLSMSFFPNPAFTPTPLYAPACSPGPVQSIRAGTSGALDGSRSFPLDGGSTLRMEWQNVPSTEPGAPTQLVHWTSSQLIPNPTFDGFAAGPLNFQLTVTDGSGQTTVCAVHDGAVATDSLGNISFADPRVGQILGPLTQWGNPNARWPWLDSIEKVWADRLGSFQGLIVPGGITTEFLASWNIAQPGVIDCVNGQTTCTGHNTTFQETFCGGAGQTTGLPNLHFIGWYNYTVPGGGGGMGRRYDNIASCPSETTLVLAFPWFPPTQTGMTFSVWTDAGLGSWINGANINYYDNVLAFYSMYYRTGIDSYLHSARWLADAWWTMPFIDRGNANDCASNTGSCNNSPTFPRNFALTGMYLRAIDQDTVAGVSNSSLMWPGLRQLTDGVFRYPINVAGKIGDLRENAYEDMFIALCAAYDPDQAHAAACRADVASLIDNRWRQGRFPDGSWKAWAGNNTSVQTVWPDSTYVPGLSVNVQPGSNVITLVGGTWDQTWFPAGTVIRTLGDFRTPSTLDPHIYQATFVDSTHITISPAYSDPCGAAHNSCSGRDFVTGNTGGWIGFGTQPFMLGIAGHWFNQAYIALSQDSHYQSEAALAFSYLLDAATWVTKSTLDGSGGSDPATRGALYGVGFGTCTPGTDSNGCRCGPNNGNCGSVYASRENMGEALGALSIAYAYAPNPSLFSALDDVFSAAYAKFPGDPGYDGSYLLDLDTFFLGTNNTKWFGFFWGMGRNSDYLSSYQGGLAPPIFVPVQISPDLSRVPGAVRFRVALTSPNGHTMPPVTCSVAPCLVTIDKTLGSWTAQISYLSASGSVISSGRPFPVHPQ